MSSSTLWQISWIPDFNSQLFASHRTAFRALCVLLWSTIHPQHVHLYKSALLQFHVGRVGGRSDNDRIIIKSSWISTYSFHQNIIYCFMHSSAGSIPIPPVHTTIYIDQCGADKEFRIYISQYIYIPEDNIVGCYLYYDELFHHITTTIPATACWFIAEPPATGSLAGWVSECVETSSSCGRNSKR